MYLAHNGHRCKRTGECHCEVQQPYLYSRGIQYGGDSAVNNVAYWEGGRWHFAGCLYGEVKDLVVFGNQLYAAGSFDVCAALADVNLHAYPAIAGSSCPGLVAASIPWR